MPFSTSTLAGSPTPAGSTAISALTFSGGACAPLKPTRAGLSVEQDHAGTDAVDLGDVSRERRVIIGGPARHVLLGEIIVALVRKLAARHQLPLRGIGIVGVRAVADPKPLERIGGGEEYRLALE